MAASQEDKLDVIKPWLEAVKNVVQISAILVGGYWTYYKFIRAEAPALETRADVSSEITWDSSSIPKSCFAYYSMHIQNVGQTTFSVDSVRIRGWKFELPRSKNSLATLVNLREIEKGPTFFDQSYDSPIPVGPYSPGVKANETMTWIVQRVPNTFVLFKAQFYLNEKGKPHIQKPTVEEPSWDTEAWQEACSTVIK